MNSEQLAKWLEAKLPAIASLKLNSGRLQVRYVLNWGGFVNHSFSVDDGTRQYHLKLTNDSDSVCKLSRWHGIHDLLEQRYRAPKVLDWVDLPEIGFAGLLQQHVDGHTANLRGDPALLKQLIALMSSLHQDGDIRSCLTASESSKTYLDHFVETYIDRFTADLEIISAGRLSFISSDLLQWMRYETVRLREAASCEKAFNRPAREPVHGDLNEGNVLLTPDEWFVLDWDDLALGDPAVEFAVLLWPMIYEGRQWSEFFIPEAGGAFRTRMEVCLRAQLLDEVIDPLADFVAAVTAPSIQAEVQRAKRARHEEAVERYRRIW